MLTLCSDKLQVLTHNQHIRLRLCVQAVHSMALRNLCKYGSTSQWHHCTMALPVQCRNCAWSVLINIHLVVNPGNQLLYAPGQSSLDCTARALAAELPMLLQTAAAADYSMTQIANVADCNFFTCKQLLDRSDMRHTR